MRHADAVVTVSSGVAGLFKDHYGGAPVVLRNVHDPRIEEDISVTLREMAGCGDDAFLIAVVGNRKPAQVIEPIIEALKQTPASVHVAFVGRGHDETADFARRIGLGSRVHTVGTVAPGEVVPFIRSADAAALLYRPLTQNDRHMLPNGFFQSIAAGLPLLLVPLPEMLTVIGGRTIGREIDPEDSRSIGETISWMLANPKALEAMCETARALARELSWEGEEQALFALVDEILSRPDSAPKV